MMITGDFEMNTAEIADRIKNMFIRRIQEITV